MKNYVQAGVVITLLAPYALASGDGVLVGSLFGVATTSAANGFPVEVRREGVVDLPALASDTAAQGGQSLLGCHQQAHHRRGHRQHAGGRIPQRQGQQRRDCTRVA